MFIHISEEKRRVHRGFVADICPLCSAPGACAIGRIEHRAVVCFIPLAWKPLHHDARCAQCNAAFKVKPTDYTSIATQPAASMTDLIALTNPALVDRLERALDLETSITTGNVTDNLREEVILRAFRDTTRLAEPPGFLVNGLVFIAATIFPLAIIADHLANSPPPGRPSATPGQPPLQTALLLFVFLVVFVALLNVILWLRNLYMQHRRRHLYDAVARQLLRVNLTRDQLRAAIYLLRAEKNRLCRYASAKHPAAIIWRRVDRFARVQESPERKLRPGPPATPAPR